MARGEVFIKYVEPHGHHFVSPYVGGDSDEIGYTPEEAMLAEQSIMKNFVGSKLVGRTTSLDEAREWRKSCPIGDHSRVKSF